MSKEEPKKPLTEIEIKMAVDGLGRSANTIKRYFAQQLMAFAADNNGEIDITNKQFTDGIASLKDQTKEKQLEGNPNATGGVLSLAQAEIDMREGVKEAVSRGADAALFEPAKALLVSVKDELTEKLQSNKGVASLVGEFIKDQSLVNGMPFMKKTGAGLVPQEKADLIAQLAPHKHFLIMYRPLCVRILPLLQR